MKYLAWVAWSWRCDISRDEQMFQGPYQVTLIFCIKSRTFLNETEDLWVPQCVSLDLRVLVSYCLCLALYLIRVSTWVDSAITGSPISHFVVLPYKVLHSGHYDCVTKVKFSCQCRHVDTGYGLTITYVHRASSALLSEGIPFDISGLRDAGYAWTGVSPPATMFNGVSIQVITCSIVGIDSPFYCLIRLNFDSN